VKLETYITVISIMIIAIIMFFVTIKISTAIYSFISNFVFIIMLIVVGTLLFLAYKLWKFIHK